MHFNTRHNKVLCSEVAYGDNTTYPRSDAVIV
jgi:hypothetical protein